VVEYKKTLVCAVGLSPQILTETVYALAVAQEMPWVPDEIFVITTDSGYQKLKSHLMDPETGWLSRLCREYGLPVLTLDADKVVILGRDCEAMSDIRTPEENMVVGDEVLRLIRRLTLDTGRQLHVSLAGGRKTMSFYMGYCLSLLGRDQDRLSHVLVEPQYERTDFFYPPSESVWVEGTQGERLDLSQAKVTLGMVPFFPMRGWLPESLLLGDLDFGSTILQLRAGGAVLKIVLDLSSGDVLLCGQSLKMPPSELRLYAWFIWIRKHGLFDQGGCQFRDAQVCFWFRSFAQAPCVRVVVRFF
jgi:CRISPR-associated protein (TIGR02584 family)